MLLCHLSSDDQWQESKCVLQEIYRVLSLQGVWRENLLHLVSLQLLRETCYTSFENVFVSSIKHMHKKLCRHWFISADMCCMFPSLEIEDQETRPLSQELVVLWHMPASWEVIWTASVSLHWFYDLPQIWIFWNFKNFFAKPLKAFPLRETFSFEES